MKSNNIYQKIFSNYQKGTKGFSVLIDPDKITDLGLLKNLVNLSVESTVDLFLVGGSLITHDSLNPVISFLKSECNIPVVLFPGSSMHLNYDADAILFLSLISGRNPDLLIGQHVVAAPLLKKSPLEIISTGYMLISENKNTTVAYMSNTNPIPPDKYSVAASTAMAGEMLGMKLIYLDAGSGAGKSIAPRMISTVKKSVNIPIMAGGGIRSVTNAKEIFEAGADYIVVGNGIEEKPELLIEISEFVKKYNDELKVH